MVHIVTGDPRPIFRQIMDGLSVKIASGELPEGSRLPSVRGLAQLLMVNANTVAKAYAELTTQGMIESRKGVGVFVCARRQTFSAQERERRISIAIDRLVADVIPLGYTPEEITQKVAAALAPLSIGEPSHGDDHDV